MFRKLHLRRFTSNVGMFFQQHLFILGLIQTSSRFRADMTFICYFKGTFVCKNMTRESRAIVCLSSLRLFADYLFRPSPFVCQKLNTLILSIPVLSKCSKVNNVIQFTTRR